MTRTHALRGFAALAGVLLLSTGCQKSEAANAKVNAEATIPTRTVTVQTVGRGSVVTKIDIVGELQGIEEVRVFSQVPDRIRTLTVNEGDKVRKGDIIATIWGEAQAEGAMLADERFEFVFERPDVHNVKLQPDDVLIALHDWIDDAETQATLNLSGTGDPFPDGFSDENRNYMSAYPLRYRSKNASFDTLDELYMVDGVTDLFMAAFRDRITVYPDKNKLLNINTASQEQMLLNIFRT